MDERVRFVARLLEGEPMSHVCREFGISRKTGYKIVDRYKDHGLEGLTDRSRRPVRYANQLPHQIKDSNGAGEGIRTLDPNLGKVARGLSQGIR
jgi:transposase